MLEIAETVRTTQASQIGDGDLLVLRDQQPDEEEQRVARQDREQPALDEDDQRDTPQRPRAEPVDPVLRIEQSVEQHHVLEVDKHTSRVRGEAARDRIERVLVATCSRPPRLSRVTDEPIERFVVGVGPWQGDWPTDPHFDPELLEHGDRRNVVDRYRYWRLDAIVADLDTRRHPFHVAIENWQHDFNIGSVVRTANAFLAAEVHIVGRKRWNRRGAMVTDRYQHLRHHESVADLAGWAAAERPAAASASTTCRARSPIETADLPSALRARVRPGGSGPDRRRCGRPATTTLSIAQFGSTRSINAGAAAAIAMHTWIRQHVRRAR